LLNLGFYLSESADNTIFIAFNLALSKLYTISMMYTLNHRKSAITAMEAGYLGSSVLASRGQSERWKGAVRIFPNYDVIGPESDYFSN